jgi:hypothetical protein
VAGRRHWERVAQVKVRLPEYIRWSLDREASKRGHSMNAEIVRRLRESLLVQDKTTSVIAQALLNGLDSAIVDEMVDTVNRQYAEDMIANDQLDEMHEREGEEREREEREGKEGSK